ncbi:MAG TPA: MFS transporter [Solirubrobacteraceae bacterium]|jgi:predicted MFS family arabinose efflux permease|nr:MFS transporter [Solirubrobacteraceae bacterium]
MRHAVFRRFIYARSLSQLGGWMQVVAAGWLIYRLTGSAAAVGALAALQKIPTIVGTPIGGGLADRYDRRRLAMRTLSFQVIPPTLLALLALDHELHAYEIYVLVFLGAIPSAVTSPVLNELAPHLVPEPLQHPAVADAAVAFNVARTVGPVIGGGLVVAIGVPIAFALNALSFVVVIVMLRSLPHEHAERGRLGRRGTMSFRAAARAVLRRPLVRMVLITVLAFFVFVAPIQQLMPVISAEHGEGAALLGVFLSALAIGGISANPLVRRLIDRGTSALLMVGAAVSVAGLLTIALALSRDPVLDWVVLLFIGGTWEVLWVTAWSTAHFRSPEGLSGEAMGLLFMNSSLGLTVGAVAIGKLFDAFGVEDTLIGIGSVVLAFGVIPTLVGRRVSDSA